MKYGNDPEARAEYSERFGDPQQQGIHETFMRPQPCAVPAAAVGPYEFGDVTDNKKGN